MARVNIIRWDDTDILPVLLSEGDTAMINHIDTTGSAGTLTLGSGSAAEIVLGTSGMTGIQVSGATNFHAFVMASASMKVTGTVDLPGQTSFSLDGTALTTTNFIAGNVDILLNGSNADALHTHTIVVASGNLSGSTIKDADIYYTYQVNAASIGLSGTDVVFLTASNRIDLADSDAVNSSRIIGIASGSVAVTYDPDAQLDVATIYGTRVDGFTGLTPAAVYYLDAAPGQLTTTPSPAGGRTVVQVGIAASATEFLFQPDIIVKGLP